VEEYKKISEKLYTMPKVYFEIGFWVLIILTMMQFVVFKYAPSLDGPQHLHNAFVLKDLLLNKGMVRDFYNINPIPVAYWTSHILLTAFTVIFPPWLAEKLFLLVFIAGVSLAYRYFVRSMDMEYNPIAQYLIFPFAASFFLLAGFYAFSYGVLVMLIAFGYWNRISSDFTWGKAGKFSLLLLLLYFTHGLVFVFFAASFLLHFLYEGIIDLSKGRNNQDVRKALAVKTMRTISAFVPVLILLLIYFSSVLSAQPNSGGDPADARELLQQLFRIRPIIGFHHRMESAFTKPLFFALLLVCIVIVIQYLIKLQQNKITLASILKNKSNIYFLLSFLFLIVYLINPDRFTSGTMTVRVGYLLFLFLIMWLPFNRIPLPVNILMGLAILYALIYSLSIRSTFYDPPLTLIREIQEVDPYLDEGATMITFRESENWLHLHFGLYAGLNKHMVNLNNPQCYGPFPLVWDTENSFAMFAGEKQIDVTGLGRLDPDKHPSRQVDYILVFYHQRFLDNEANAEWNAILAKEYELLYLTSGEAAALYKRNY